jgi:hypothetical protein
MAFPRATEIAQLLVKARVQTGDRVVDATVGNGYDTLFLANCVGTTGRVDGFDIQECAIVSTRSRLGNDAPVFLHLRGHEEMAAIVAPGISAVMFNLGYYPSGDKTIITRPDTTLTALDAALNLLSTSGLLTIVIYPGHAGGAEEADRVETWLTDLPPDRYRTVRYGPQGKTGNSPPPYLLAIERRG